MFFKTSENAFRTTHGTACPLVQESQDHLSFRTENSVLIVDSLSDLKSGSRQGLDGCNGSHDITHLCRIAEPALQRDIAKVLYGSTDMPYLEKIASEISNTTKDLDVSYSSNRYLEFNHQGVNKGEGLLWLADKLGIKPEETMALGDNFNDLSMIEAAGLGVGVANVNPKMKDDCDYITKADNNQGGVGEAIEKFVLEK